MDLKAIAKNWLGVLLVSVHPETRFFLLNRDVQH